MINVSAELILQCLIKSKCLGNFSGLLLSYKKPYLFDDTSELPDHTFLFAIPPVCGKSKFIKILTGITRNFTDVKEIASM